jgi:hypothetical protein
MRQIFINKSLFKLISKYCKQLVCIHLFGPKSGSKSPQIDFKGIGKLLSDKIEVEINFGHDLREDSIIVLIQNMPQIKNIGFDSCYQSIRELIPHFGLNIRSLSINSYNDLRIEDLNAIKNNSDNELKF